MLSLLLVQGRSFQQIAEMLHMAPEDVRSRAHAAAEQLAGTGADQLSPSGRARIIDYLLGEQSVSERELTRSELTSLDASREWARMLSAGLAAMAREPLPSIPGPEKDDVSVAHVVPEPASPPPRPAPSPSPAPSPAPAERRRVHTGWLVAALVVFVGAFVAIVIIAIDSGGRSSSPSHPPLTTAPVSAPAPSGSTKGAKTIRRLVLTAASSASKAFGAGAVISQHGKLLLLLQARGLAPNHHNSYGVWLYNAPGDARLLGFVSPPVGPAGTFSSSVGLPDDAVRFHSLVITIESSNLPKQPGQQVLRSPLSLP
jgi:hypothetical protein